MAGVTAPDILRSSSARSSGETTGHGKAWIDPVKAGIAPNFRAILI